MSDEIVKTCSCGRRYTRAQWEKLPNLKHWELPWGEVLEMRDCTCLSTMSIQLKPGEPELEGLKSRMPAWIKI